MMTLPTKPFSIGYQSDTGRVRTQDEDSLAIMDVSTIYHSQEQRRILMIVADGLGGHAKGEIASRLVVETVTRTVGLGLLEVIDDAEALLRSSLLQANHIILDQVQTHPANQGMGSTASVALVDDQRLFVGHVGDTRVYVIRNQMIQITNDHSTVQQLIDRGLITREQARTHPRRNEVTRALGIQSQVKVDTHTLRLETGDYILLCCDGLINEVQDMEIQNLVLRSTNVQQACDKLVELANQRGGHDNISIVLVGPFHFSPA